MLETRPSSAQSSAKSPLSDPLLSSMATDHRSACSTSLGLRAGGSGRDPDLLPIGFARCLRGLRLDPIEPITEPPWNRGTRLIGLVGMNFDAVNISQAERNFSQDAHGSGGVAAAEVVRVQPITDLERSRPDAAVQPEHPQDRPVLGMAQHIAVVGALVPVQLGFAPAGTLCDRISCCFSRP